MRLTCLNPQFVNFTSIMSRNATLQQKESAFALAALMEVPIQYKATMELGILGRTTGKAKRVVPAPPPLPASSQRQPSSLRREGSGVNAAAAEPREDQVQQNARGYLPSFVLSYDNTPGVYMSLCRIN
jgi:E3 ubiquitin-protein ligase RGLG